MSHALHVLIRGHVFTYEEKAPFVASGVSVLGAVEYDEESDRIKCHECSEWMKDISRHAKHAHGISSRDYRLRHGLRLDGGLMSRSSSHIRAKLSKRAMPKTLGDKVNGAQMVRQPGQHVGRKRVEGRNEDGRCRAQLAFRLQLLAAGIGHTPSQAELREAGLLAQLRSMFGSCTQACVYVGLTPNISSRADLGKRPLPKGFPSKDELECARMPWPKEYFGTGLPRSSSPLAGA